MNLISTLTPSRPRLWLIALAALMALSIATVTNAQAGSGGFGGEGQKAADDTRSTTSSSAGKYSSLWNNVPKKEKRWAKRTSACESGGDPRAVGGGGKYRGAFQFLKSTWRTSPKSPGGDPVSYDYETQAVVAVALKKRDGAGHWPVCG